MDEAEYCNRVCMMVDGKIEQLDSPENLRRKFGVETMEEVFTQVAKKALRTDD